MAWRPSRRQQAGFEKYIEDKNMGRVIELLSADGFQLDAYLTIPKGKPKGGVVVVQEIFGVNEHIKAIVNDFAAEGYAALAPALFDRFEKGLALGYAADDRTKGAEIAFSQLAMSTTLQDLTASVAYMKTYGRVGIVGYCYGGLMSYLAACNVAELTCAVSYYGGRIVDHLDQTPKTPIILHFGERDTHSPMEDVFKIASSKPNIPVFTYDAGHGFNCNHRSSFDANAAKLARERTLQLFEQELFAKES